MTGTHPRKNILLLAAAVAAVLLGAFLLFRGRGAAKAGAAGAGAAGADKNAQSVTVFEVATSTFTDVLTGLIGTVKGGAIELTYGGAEEVLSAVHVKLGQTVDKGHLLFELDHVRAGARKAQADIALDRAKKLEEAGGATHQEVREARAAYDIALRDWEDTFIRAPKRGVVSAINKQVGETVGRNDVLGVVVSKEDKLLLETGVIEGQLDRVAAGQQAVVEIEALGGSPLKGEVIGVSREVSTTGRTGTVQISLPAQIQAKLRPGLSARCRIVTFNGPALVVPRQAYDSEKGGVYKVVQGKAVFTSAELGHLTPDWYELKTGVAPGEQVVRDLIINPVEDGAAVTPAGEPEKYKPEEEGQGGS
jgi:membrane fusion protein, multidrug efflux system